MPVRIGSAGATGWFLISWQGEHGTQRFGMETWKRIVSAVTRNQDQGKMSSIGY